jgi:hypothetical protein
VRSDALTAVAMKPANLRVAVSCYLQEVFLRFVGFTLPPSSRSKSKPSPVRFVSLLGPCDGTIKYSLQDTVIPEASSCKFEYYTQRFKLDRSILSHGDKA